MTIENALNCLWAEVARYNPDSRVREAWQTLNTEVLAQQSTNNARDEILLCAKFNPQCSKSLMVCDDKNGECIHQRKTSPVA